MLNSVVGLPAARVIATMSVALLALSGCGGGKAALVGAILPGAVEASPAKPAPISSPTPTPSPTSTPSSSPTPSAALNGVVAEGDSISYFWTNSYTGIYAAEHSSVEYHGLAVSGAGIANMIDRLPSVIKIKPAIVTFLIGANDLGADNWLIDVFAYADRVRATGAKVAVGTLLNRCLDTNAYPHFLAANKKFIIDRAEANKAIRSAVGSRIDAVIDFAADPLIGTDSACTDKSLFSDGTHPTEAAHRRMAVIYSEVMDRFRP